MHRLRLRAPAKINHYLNVLAKRPDGFHNIETIFEKINLCDEISLIRRKQGIKVLSKCRNVPKGSRNICLQAAKALFARGDCRFGVIIKIRKNIPVAAGLGGGSSDAASVLVGLDKLFSFRLPRRQLLKIAEELGADVPFFLLSSVRALGQGKGEILTPLKLKRKFWYILVIPSFRVSTKSMYQHPRITLTRGPGSVKIVLRALKTGDLSSLNKYSYNSFERILQKRYNQVWQIKKALKNAGARTALVSGSGPCVFAITQTRKEAMGIRDRLKTKVKNCQIIVTETFKPKAQKTANAQR